ncbi:MAG: response regulator [Betaproteobacteria bacterium]
MIEAQLQRILYVEDEPDIRQVAQLALEAVGRFETRVCASGAEALRAFPVFRPDLILLDVMMPGMDGPTTLKRLRELPGGAQTPAIFMTAKIQPDEVVALHLTGALGVIPKPFDPMTLAQSIRDLWAARARASEPALPATTSVTAPALAAVPGSALSLSAASPIAAASAPAPAVVATTAADAAGDAMAELENELRRIAANYVVTLPEKIAEVKALCQALQGGTAAAEPTLDLRRAVHTIHGSAETFGLPGVTRAAAQFEAFLKPLIDQTAPITPALMPRVTALLSALEQAAAICEPGAGSRTLSGATTQSRQAAATAPTLYLLQDEKDIDETLGAQLSAFGYASRRFSVPAELLQACAIKPPAAVIADIALLDTNQDNLNAITQLRNSLLHPPPVVFLAEADDVGARLRAVRAGGGAYLHKPVRIASLIDKLDDLCHGGAPEPYRVLIIDDSSEQAAFHATILRHAGMMTETVKDPLLILEALSTFSPDLVLMDMYLPHCSGDELARVIRQLEPHVGVPIVFLSIERDFDKQVAALFGAGDEFLTKPIEPHHLVSVVTSHVEHYQKLRSLMVQDGLTGLANHSHLQRELERETARALRHDQPLAVAMIDIDHFKQVNDRHGHPTGDRVLRGLSRFLRQRLRSSDLVARYGGEEFAVLLPSAEGSSARGVLDRLRADFAAILHQNDRDESFHVTFSVGLAALPTYRTGRELLLAADRALYESKAHGRNCVRLSG